MSKFVSRYDYVNNDTVLLHLYTFHHLNPEFGFSESLAEKEIKFLRLKLVSRERIKGLMLRKRKIIKTTPNSDFENTKIFLVNDKLNYDIRLESCEWD